MSPAWHDEARALLDSGMLLSEIAKSLKRTPSMIRWALDIDGERQKTRDRVNARRTSFRGSMARAYARRARGAENASPALAPRGGITLPYISFLADHRSATYSLAAPDYFVEGRG